MSEAQPSGHGRPDAARRGQNAGRMPRGATPFEDDEKFERKLFWRQLAIVVVAAALVVLRILVG
jgi:hypothetical protein